MGGTILNGPVWNEGLLSCAGGADRKVMELKETFKARSQVIQKLKALKHGLSE